MRPPAAPTPQDTERAPEQLIRDWLDEHGPVRVGPAAIAQTWSLDHLGDHDRRAIGLALERVGVHTDPRLDEAHGDDLLTLHVGPPPVQTPEAPTEAEQPCEVVVVQEAKAEAPAARVTRRAPALVLVALRWTVLGLALGLVGALGAAKVTGHETLTVMSGSMEPAIHTGDMVTAKPISPLEARVGDILTFQEPHGKGRLITHRVRRMRVDRHKVRFVTKGDANNTVEEWQIPDDGKVARVTNRGWKVGYALAFMRDPDKRLFLISIPAVLLGLFELVRIWRPQPAPRAQRGDHGAAAA